jgi:hypothetical protein
MPAPKEIAQLPPKSDGHYDGAERSEMDVEDNGTIEYGGP